MHLGFSFGIIYLIASQSQGPVGGSEAISVSASIAGPTRMLTVFVLVPPDPFGLPAVAADATLLSAIAGTQNHKPTQAL